MKTKQSLLINFTDFTRLICAGTAMALLLVGTAASSAPYVVTTTADSGVGSLRQAILNAETLTPSIPDVITFGILTPPPWIITLLATGWSHRFLRQVVCKTGPCSSLFRAMARSSGCSIPSPAASLAAAAASTASAPSILERFCLRMPHQELKRRIYSLTLDYGQR